MCVFGSFWILLIRLTFLNNTPVAVVSIIQKCRQQTHTLRPSAAVLSSALEQYIESKSVEASMKAFQTCSFDTANVDTTATTCNETVSETTDSGIMITTHCVYEQYEEASNITIEVDEPEGTSTDLGPYMKRDHATLNAQSVQVASLSTASVTLESIASVGTIHHDIAYAKAQMKIKELKQFQTQCLEALKNDKDAIIVQPVSQHVLYYLHCFHLERFVLS